MMVESKGRKHLLFESEVHTYTELGEFIQSHLPTLLHSWISPTLVPGQRIHAHDSCHYHPVISSCLVIILAIQGESKSALLFLSFVQ